MDYSENLVWMDLEMSGLDPESERILEIATIITDSSLNIIAEGPVVYVHQDQALIDGMDAWNSEHHSASGLIDLIQREGVPEAEAERITLAFISSHVEAGKSPLCGNSIAQDRRFLVRYMPRLEQYLHYRNLDVSTVKELCMRWRPDVFREVRKQGTHRALDDIRESIAELRFYRDHFFNLS
ncbi:MAG: oligoribonuclease [Pseudomonadota bacterium]